MLKLVKLEEKHMPLLIDMMDEWYATGEKIVPYVIRKVDYHNFTTYSESLELKEARDGVRPSERRKGVATAMIGLALLECCRLGIERVLMVCDKENTGSAKSIQNNGGILENEIEADGLNIMENSCSAATK